MLSLASQMETADPSSEPRLLLPSGVDQLSPRKYSRTSTGCRRYQEICSVKSLCEESDHGCSG